MRNDKDWLEDIVIDLQRYLDKGYNIVSTIYDNRDPDSVEIVITMKKEI